jgi:hypothetical protein
MDQGGVTGMAFGVLVERPQGKRLFRRLGSRWENIKINLIKRVCEGLDWKIGLGWAPMAGF